MYNNIIEKDILVELNCLKLENSYLRFKRNDKKFKMIHLFKLNRKKIARVKTKLFLLRVNKGVK